MVADKLHTRTHEYDGLGREIKTTLADARQQFFHS